MNILVLVSFMSIMCAPLQLSYLFLSCMSRTYFGSGSFYYSILIAMQNCQDA